MTNSTLKSPQPRRLFAGLAVGGALAALPVAAPAGSLLAPPAAEAAVTSYTTTTEHIGGGTDVNVRSAPKVTVGNPNNTVRKLPAGAPLSIDCQLVGSRLGFSRYADNRTWNKLTDGKFIHDAVTTSPGGPRTTLPDGGYVAWSPTIPRCGATAPAPTPPAPSRESRAVDWARAQLQDPGSSSFSGLCERFVENAYGTSGRYESAIAHHNSRQGEMRSDANPPAGALVFYDWADYGHVGISIGDGQVISTQGDGTQEVGPVRQHTVTGLGLAYLGWAPAPEGWPGR